VSSTPHPKGLLEDEVSGMMAERGSDVDVHPGVLVVACSAATSGRADGVTAVLIFSRQSPGQSVRFRRLRGFRRVSPTRSREDPVRLSPVPAAAARLSRSMFLRPERPHRAPDSSAVDW
jgi:hypothetical protein